MIVSLSCTKKLLETSPKAVYNNYSVEEKTELISSYAQILAASLSNNELRSKIKTEAQLNFDGDYDVLTQKLENIRLERNNMLVRNLMSNTCIMTRSNENGYKGSLDELLAEIQRTFPNLQVSVPVLCDDWDTDNHIPLVAYLPYDFNDQTTKEIEAFDVYGNSYMISSVEEPDRPVIVVSISERVDRFGNIIFDSHPYVISDEEIARTKALTKPSGLALLHGSARSLTLNWNAKQENTSDPFMYEISRRKLSESTFSTIATVGGSESSYTDMGLTAGSLYNYRIRKKKGNEYSAYTSILSTTASERSVNDVLKLVYYQMSEAKLKSLESWTQGRPEIRLSVFYGTDKYKEAGLIYQEVLTPTRQHIKDGCNPERTICSSWNPNISSSVLTFVWIEEDTGISVEYTYSTEYEQKNNNGTLVTGGTCTVTGYDEDDFIGYGHVYWWNSKSMTFSVGINWRLN